MSGDDSSVTIAIDLDVDCTPTVIDGDVWVPVYTECGGMEMTQATWMKYEDMEPSDDDRMGTDDFRVG